jgi:hypothetical protein
MNQIDILDDQQYPYHQQSHLSIDHWAIWENKMKMISTLTISCIENSAQVEHHIHHSNCLMICVEGEQLHPVEKLPDDGNSWM